MRSCPASGGRGGGEEGEPPSLLCPALPGPALPSPARPPGTGASAAAEGDAGGAGCGEGRGGGAGHRSPQKSSAHTAASRRSPPVRPGCFPAVTWLLPPPPKGFRESLHFHFGPAKGLPGAAAPDRSSRSEGLAHCPAPFPAPEGDEGQSSARSASLVGVWGRPGAHCSGVLLGAALLLSTFLARFK